MSHAISSTILRVRDHRTQTEPGRRSQSTGTRGSNRSYPTTSSKTGRSLNMAGHKVKSGNAKN
jgi:hypothetical protein